MSWEIGDKIYFLKKDYFRITKGKCSHCNGSGVVKGLQKGFPNLKCSCPYCHATGSVEKRHIGCWVIGPNTIVDVAKDTVAVSGNGMLEHLTKLKEGGLTQKDAFFSSSRIYGWERVKKNNLYETKDAAIKEIEKINGILVGG